jgi:hypothetical protein
VKVATRIAVPLALAAAVVIGIALPIPISLPAIALGSRELLCTERTLILFYAFLLLFVPVVRALDAELPIELSTRGARWRETASASGEALATLDRRVRAIDKRISVVEDFLQDER